MASRPIESACATPHRRRRWRWFVGGLIAYALIGCVLLPMLLRWQLPALITRLTHRPARVNQVNLNPFALSLTIRGLAIDETNGEPFAGFDEFHANFQLSSLFRRTWTFEEIRLASPTARIVRAADGSFNFADLLARSKTTPAATNQPPAPIPPVLVFHLAVTNGLVSFTDHTRAGSFHADHGPIDLNLHNFTTRRDQHGPYSFTATTSAGESFAWMGTVSVNPPRSAGELKLGGIPLAKYAPYLAEFTTARPTNGTVSVEATYRLDAATLPPALEVTNARVQLRDLAVTAPTGEDVLTLTNLTVSGIHASMGGRRARVASIAIEGGSLLLRREADGGLNLLKLLPPAAPAAPAMPRTQKRANDAPWTLQVDDLDAAGFSVTVQDRTLTRAAELGFDELRLRVRDFSTESNAPLRLAVGFKGRAGGTVAVEAKGTFQPIAIDASVAVTNLPLAPMQPYAEQFTHLVINSGTVSSTGRMRYAPLAAEGAPIQFNSELTVNDFKLSETLTFKELVRWDSHTVSGVEVDLAANWLPRRVRIEEIKFAALNAGVTILSNGQPNVLALVKPLPAAAPAASTQSTNASAAPPVEFPVEIGAFVLERTALHATDLSIKPRFQTSVEEINGAIRQLRWPQPGRTRIELAGKVSALAPFSIQGEVTPDPKRLFVDLALAFKNSDLTPLTPYMEKFAGHPLNKGKLTFDLRYHVENRALKGENVLAIDQLTLGPRNNSTNATKLPVRLAVALLKDRNGRIDLNLPVSGSLDDPKFSVGSVILKVFVNLLVKVATSPFSLLGAMFGGGEELQFVDFAPGSATLADTQTNRLEKLSRALFERPALTIEISGMVDPVADAEALTRAKLTTAMKSLRLKELADKGRPVPPIDELQLTDDDYQDLLRRAYKEAFNSTPERALREARAAAATNPVPGAASVPQARSSEPSKGVEQLLRRSSPAPASSTVSTKGTTANAPARPKTEAEWIRDELERRLMGTMTATDDELKELQQRRATVVQKYFLDSGRVEGERLFLVAPRPVDRETRGQPRVVFSLN